MAKTSNINIRISPEKKKEAEQLFSTFGITVTDAINIFLSMSILEGGFPFEIKQPKYNYETEQAIKEARDIISGKIEAKSYSSLDELLKDLESDDKC
ncbi:type II toxin-antitoxin system RelB/DinJ family antitoxin [Lagierella sp. ICN-221743]